MDGRVCKITIPVRGSMATFQPSVLIRKKHLRRVPLKWVLVVNIINHKAYVVLTYVIS